MTARRLLLLAALAASWIATGPAVAATEPLKAGVFEPPRAAPDVALRGSDGREFKLANYRGKVVLLAFGFTSCPAVCPTTLATLAQARGELGAAAADVQVVFVTVDPERDDVARLKAYVAAFDPAFVGATGEPAALERARQGFGATAAKVPVGSSYAFDHTSSVFIVDRQGRLRGMMPYGRSARDYVHDLRILLAAK
jgi:protein SCO1/2